MLGYIYIYVCMLNIQCFAQNVLPLFVNLFVLQDSAQNLANAISVCFSSLVLTTVKHSPC